MKWLFRKIKRWFTPAHKPSRPYGSHGSPLPVFKPIWGICLPHYSFDGGAETNDNKWSEYTYAGYMNSLSSIVNHPVDNRNFGDVKGAAKRLLIKGCNCYIEQHKDAYNHNVGGFSFLYIKGDSLSKKYASIFRDEFKKAFPDRNPRYSNGLKALEKGDDGFWNLSTAKKQGMEVAILAEDFFIDNDKEWISPEVSRKFWDSVLING